MSNFDISCQKCHENYTSNHTISSGQTFVTHTCPHCSAKCNQCILCNKQYFFSKKNQLRGIKNHISTCQKDSIKKSDDLSTLESDDAFFDNQDSCRDMEDDEAENILDQLEMETTVTDKQHQTINIPIKSVCQNIDLEDFNMFSNFKSNVYFWQEYICQCRNKMHGGVRGIAWRSMYQKKLYDHTKLTSVPDARLLFNMTQHVMTNTAEQNDSFFDIIEEVQERCGASHSDVTLPTNNQSAEQILKEHQFGIFGNLPHEEVELINNHACISMIGLIQHLMAHQIPIAFTEETDLPGDTRRRENSHGCKAMDELIDRMKQLNVLCIPTKYGFYLLWSDGFVRSFVKQKNNNVWIITLTVPDPGNNATSKYHTYCLAVGKSSNDHQPVIDYYMKQVEQLMRGVSMFDVQSGKYINVQMGLLAYIADRPERHAILNQADGGLFGKRTLWCANIDHKHLPYCDNCFSKELKALMNDRFSQSPLSMCGRCCQWDMKSSSNANAKVKNAEIITTEKYPTSADLSPGSPPVPVYRPVPTNHLRPVELQFVWLVAVIRFTAHNIIYTGWNKGTTKSYLKSCCVPDRVIDNVYAKFKQVNANENLVGNIVQSNDYIPFIWLSKILMSTWIDAGMHHIFHGIVARIMLVVEDVFTDEEKKSTFEDLVNPYLLELMSLRLDWLHVKTLPKTHWLAEDELGMSRIMCFVYGQFFLNVTLRQSSTMSSASLVSIRQMLSSLSVMISLLMSSRDPDVTLIDRHIKIFLSCCQRFCDLYFSSDTKPFWANTSNFPSLLNLPSQIERFGPIRWYWEGTRERFIQTVKKVLVSMRNSNSYFVRKLEVMQKITTMWWISDRLRKQSKGPKKEYPRLYYRYESMEEIEEKILEGQVLSGLTTMKDENTHLEDHIWLVFGKQGSKVSIVPFQLNYDEDTETLIGLSYHTYEFQNEAVIHDMATEDLGINTSDYCVMLPFVQGNKENFKKQYAVVFDDWDVIDGYGEKNLPTLCKVEFASDVKRY